MSSLECTEGKSPEIISGLAIRFLQIYDKLISAAITKLPQLSFCLQLGQLSGEGFF